MYVIKTLGTQAWKDNIEGLQTFLVHQSFLIENHKAEELVVLFQTIVDTLSSIDTKLLKQLDNDLWSKRVYNAVSSAVKSKLGGEYREAALTVSSAMVDLFGVPWTMTASGDNKFLLILVHLSCIEIRMTLEQCDIEKITQSATVICSCYKLLENVITYMTTGQSLSFDESQTKQLHSTMTGAFSSVLFFLKYVECDAPEQQGSAIVTATVRVLGSWIAEETLALQEQVIAALPFLLKLSKMKFEDSKTTLLNYSAQSDATQSTNDHRDGTLHLLLPGLCHLSADEQARNLMIACSAHELLVDYFMYTFTEFRASNDQAYQAELEVSLTTLCGVFLNLVVMESQFVSTDTHFSELLNYLIIQLPILVDAGTHVVLTFNMCVLGMMLIRHHRHQLELSSPLCTCFLSSALALLHCHVIGAAIDGSDKCELAVRVQYVQHWDDINDLWFLAMQALCALIPVCDELVAVILTSGCIPNIISNLLTVQGRQVSDVTRDSYAMMLYELASLPDPNCKNVIKQSDAKALATMYGMRKLLDALC